MATSRPQFHKDVRSPKVDFAIASFFHRTVGWYFVGTVESQEGTLVGVKGIFSPRTQKRTMFLSLMDQIGVWISPICEARLHWLLI